MIVPDLPLGLASGSARRRQLLESLGLPLRVLRCEVDERKTPGEPIAPYLERVVRSKLAGAVLLREARDVAALLVADTIVAVDGDLLGKPADIEGAKAMLRRLSGRAHEVFTRFALGSPAPEARLLHEETVRSEVWFRTLDPEEIAGYAETGEGLDKAGAYAIQGLGSFAIERIEGAYANVVGLPVCEVVLALKRHGLLRGFPGPLRGT